MGLLAAGAGVGGGISILQAVQRNQAIAKSMRSTVAAGQAQQVALGQQTAVELQKRVDDLAAVRGRIRSAAAEAGVGYDGSAAAIGRAATYAAGLDESIVRANHGAQAQAIHSGVAARLTELRSSAQNPIFAALTGALSGAMTAVSIKSLLGTGGAVGTVGASANAGDGFVPAAAGGGYTDQLGMAVT